MRSRSSSSGRAVPIPFQPTDLQNVFLPSEFKGVASHGEANGREAGHLVAVHHILVGRRDGTLKSGMQAHGQIPVSEIEGL